MKKDATNQESQEKAENPERTETTREEENKEQEATTKEEDECIWHYSLNSLSKNLIKSLPNQFHLPYPFLQVTQISKNLLSPNKNISTKTHFYLTKLINWCINN